MQTLSYNLQMNGWNNIMYIKTNFQPIKNEINIIFEIFGVASGEAILNFEKGVIIPKEPISIASYKDNGKIKTFSLFTVPKFTLSQIKNYLIV